MFNDVIDALLSIFNVIKLCDNLCRIPSKEY